MATSDVPLPDHEPWGHDWWDNQITLHPPKTKRVAHVMDDTRGYFRTLGHLLIDQLPPGPDRTVALRALKDASQAAIGAIACNQDHWPDPDEGG